MGYSLIILLPTLNLLTAESLICILTSFHIAFESLGIDILYRIYVYAYEHRLFYTPKALLTFCCRIIMFFWQANIVSIYKFCSAQFHIFYAEQTKSCFCLSPVVGPCDLICHLLYTWTNVVLGYIHFIASSIQILALTNLLILFKYFQLIKICDIRLHWVEIVL